jgi:hypothetical protein
MREEPGKAALKVEAKVDESRGGMAEVRASAHCMIVRFYYFYDIFICCRIFVLSEH